MTLTQILAPKFGNHQFSILVLLELGLRGLLGFEGVLGQQIQLLGVLLFTPQTFLDGRQLVVVPDALFFESLDNLVRLYLLVSLLDALGLVEFDHDLVELVF